MGSAMLRTKTGAEILEMFMSACYSIYIRNIVSLRYRMGDFYVMEYYWRIFNLCVGDVYLFETKVSMGFNRKMEILLC